MTEPTYPGLSDTSYLISDLILRFEVLAQHVQFHAMNEKDSKKGIELLKTILKDINESKATLKKIDKVLPKL